MAKTASGSGYRSSSTKHSILRERPGAQSPGGVGVDIKHNSYDRYLNKLKGKAPLRRGIIPTNYGTNIQYNRAYPITGGKILKTNIINGCECSKIGEIQGNAAIYSSLSNAMQDQLLAVKYKFSVGDLVWGRKTHINLQWHKAQIIAIENNLYTIRFFDDESEITTGEKNIIIYFDCNFEDTRSLKEKILDSKNKSSTISNYINLNGELECSILGLLVAGEIL